MSETKAADAWSGALVLAPVPGSVIYLGPGGVADEHAHYALQLTVGIDAPVRVSLQDAEFEARALLVPSSTPHAFAADGRVAMLYLDPSSAHASQLHALQAQNFASAQLPDPAIASTDLPRYARQLLDAFGIGLSSFGERSSTVTMAVEDVRARLSEGGSITLPEVASQVAISPSRLTRLFTREVGIPFRRFVLWQRLVTAIEAIGAGDDLTRAAASAGFSDSAHLSRTFRANFGLAPSALFAMRVVAG